MRVCSLESLSDHVSSSAGDRACFPFDFRALLLGSRKWGPLLSGGATALSVGHCTQLDLQDITDVYGSSEQRGTPEDGRQVV